MAGRHVTGRWETSGNSPSSPSLPQIRMTNRGDKWKIRMRIGNENGDENEDTTWDKNEDGNNDEKRGYKYGWQISMKKGAENRVLPQGSCHSMSTASEFKIVGNKPEKIHPNLGFWSSLKLRTKPESHLSETVSTPSLRHSTRFQLSALKPNLSRSYSLNVCSAQTGPELNPLLMPCPGVSSLQSHMLAAALELRLNLK